MGCSAWPASTGWSLHPHRTSVMLNVFTRVRYVRAGLGSTVRLDCGFTVERALPVAVEWRYQYQGSGRLVYAYSAEQDRVHAAQEGAHMQLDLLHSHNNASLLLQNVQLQHEGTYICAVYLPGLQAQIPVTLEIAEPPRVALSPSPLYVSAGQSQDVVCEASGYYPLDVTVTWWRRAAGHATARPLTHSWQLGHQRNHDGTFNVTSGVQVRPGAADHGAVYTCHVDHLALAGVVRRDITLMVAGASGPKMEDAMGLLLCAFILYGALKMFHQWFFPQVNQPRVNSEEDLKKKN